MYPIKAFNYECYKCGEISFKLDISEKKEFICPICKEDLSFEIKNITDDIDLYNRITERLKKMGVTVLQ